MSPAKVTLSPKELELVTDPSWILTKNAVIGKVYDLFGNLNQAYEEILQKAVHIPQDVTVFRSPKIAKGEQYENLPWVMLDYPRIFNGADTFAVRSFFWWGNFCSIQLLISGVYQTQYADVVSRYFLSHPNACDDWYLCISADPWQHHFREDNYCPLRQNELHHLQAMPFIKLAKKKSLQEWDHLQTFFSNTFVEMTEMLSGIAYQAPKR